MIAKSRPDKVKDFMDEHRAEAVRFGEQVRFQNDDPLSDKRGRMNRNADICPGEQLAPIRSQVPAQLKTNRVAKHKRQPGKDAQNLLTMFGCNSRSELRVY